MRVSKKKCGLESVFGSGSTINAQHGGVTDCL